jgi:hypothetical protein
MTTASYRNVKPNKGATPPCGSPKSVCEPET